MLSMEYKVPEVKHTEVPLDSRLMKLETSENIKEPYVISITDPEKRNSRIQVPIRLSGDADRRLSQYKPAASVRFTLKDSLLKVSRAFTKKAKKPSVSEVKGVDTGILDAFHTSDNKAIGSMKKALDFYFSEVEPAFAYLSDLRNKKRNIRHYLKTHKLPEDVRKELLVKIDRLEHMIREAEAPYRKNRHYHQMLDKEIRDSVDTYIASISKDVLTSLEKLDIKEFNKSRKANGLMSTFARGKLQQKLMQELNWHGYDFIEVAPDYTSQTCPICSNIDSASRNGKKFKCTCCGFEDDADNVGAVNIKTRAEDEEILKACEDNKYNHDAMQKAIRDICAERNKKFVSTHPLIRPIC